MKLEKNGAKAQHEVSIFMSEFSFTVYEGKKEIFVIYYLKMQCRGRIAETLYPRGKDIHDNTVQ